MNKKHLNVIYPQWQGGGQDLSTYNGAMELMHNYLKNNDHVLIDIDTGKISDVKNDILAYSDIIKQTEKIKGVLDKEIPDTLFTVGGGCDADMIPISYINKIYEAELTLLYFDAHGDLNTPSASESKLFYGMPVRTLLGEGDRAIVNSLYSILSPEQVIMIGVRDLDLCESEYIHDNDIPVMDVAAVETDISKVLGKIKKQSKENIYIHIDLDILDPKEYPHTPVPTANGICRDTLLMMLKEIKREFHIAGMGLFEYQPTGQNNDPLIEEIIDIGIKL